MVDGGGGMGMVLTWDGDGDSRRVCIADQGR